MTVTVGPRTQHGHGHGHGMHTCTSVSQARIQAYVQSVCLEIQSQYVCKIMHLSVSFSCIEFLAIFHATHAYECLKVFMRHMHKNVCKFSCHTYECVRKTPFACFVQAILWTVTKSFNSAINDWNGIYFAFKYNKTNHACPECMHTPVQQNHTIAAEYWVILLVQFNTIWKVLCTMRVLRGESSFSGLRSTWNFRQTLHTRPERTNSYGYK